MGLSFWHLTVHGTVLGDDPEPLLYGRRRRPWAGGTGKTRWVSAPIGGSGVTMSTDRKASGYRQPAFTCDVKKRKERAPARALTHGYGLPVAGNVAGPKRVVKYYTNMGSQSNSIWDSNQYLVGSGPKAIAFALYTIAEYAIILSMNKRQQGPWPRSSNRPFRSPWNGGISRRSFSHSVPDGGRSGCAGALRIERCRSHVSSTPPGERGETLPGPIAVSWSRRDQTMNTMTYRGYAARIEYSDEDQCSGWPYRWHQ